MEDNIKKLWCIIKQKLFGGLLKLFKIDEYMFQYHYAMFETVIHVNPKASPRRVLLYFPSDVVAPKHIPWRKINNNKKKSLKPLWHNLCRMVY